MNHFVMQNTRILDTTADGVNFHIGVTNSVVENCFIRNTGDDGLEMWADRVPEVNNKFIHNTVGIPVLANNIAIYGDKDIEVSDNLVYDTISNGGGIHVSNRYPNVQGPTAVHGNHRIYRNTLLRAGNSDYNWHFDLGAIWFDGLNEEVHANIHVIDCDIIDSSYAALSYVESRVAGVVFENVHINGTGTYVIQIQKSGHLLFKKVEAHNVHASVPIFGCNGDFKLTVEGSKTGWYTDKPQCGDPRSLASKWPWNW